LIIKNKNSNADGIMLIKSKKKTRNDFLISFKKVLVFAEFESTEKPNKIKTETSENAQKTTWAKYTTINNNPIITACFIQKSDLFFNQ
jgi:hypothetical protein